jgi:hypothetical protein
VARRGAWRSQSGKRQPETEGVLLHMHSALPPEEEVVYSLFPRLGLPFTVSLVAATARHGALVIAHKLYLKADYESMISRPRRPSVSSKSSPRLRARTGMFTRSCWFIQILRCLASPIPQWFRLKTDNKIQVRDYCIGDLLRTNN